MGVALAGRRDGSFLDNSALKVLSLATMLSGANASEISDIQEDETEAGNQARQNVTMLHWAETAEWSFR